MKSILPWLASVAVFAAACTPEIPTDPAPPEAVLARFDPSASPPVVPTPNALATDPATGLLNVTLAANASLADAEFVARLNALDGFLPTASGGVTFTGELDPETVTPESIRVFDVTADFAPVEGYQVAITPLAAIDAADAKARVTISGPADGWAPGHSFAVAVIGGANGVKGDGGKEILGTSTWALLRTEKSLVTCEDLASPDCRSSTEIIPSPHSEPEARIADQAAKAVGLERLRRLYAPALDAVVKTGVARGDIALLWTFKIADVPTALFNPAASPPQVPLPNDLAINPTTGLVNAPIDPAAPAAQQEFIRDYLNTLDGFPVTAGGSVRMVGHGVKGGSVTSDTVRVIDLTAEAGEPPVAVSVSFDETARQIGVTPPAGGWTKGRQYAVILTPGVLGLNDRPLAAGDIWALVRSANPLVDCDDLASTTCKSIITTAPLTHGQAVALEGLRRSFKPVLDALGVLGLPRAEVALVWTFRIVSFAEATFNPAGSVIPFPNNLLLDPTTGRVNLPPNPLNPLIAPLNTLDGFSTIGPYVSENSATLGPIEFSTLDDGTLAAGTGFVNLTPGGNPPQVTACLNCWSSEVPGNPPTPNTGPPQLQFVTEAPLDEKSTYGAYLTSGLKDARGKKIIAAPAFALMRMASPLVENGKSLISGVPDANAAALEPARQAHKALLDALAAQGVERKEVALAWAITTQSTVTTLGAIHDVAAALGMAGALSANPTFAADVTEQVVGPAPRPAHFAAIGKVFIGEISVPHLLTGPGGTINPAAPELRTAPFILTLPDPAIAAPPAGGYPVVIFGHGLQSGRQTMLGTANTFAAAGQASIAIDHLMHGDRSDCRGVAAAIGAPSDDFACADRTTQMCSTASGRCVARVDATRADCSPTATGGVPGNLYCANFPQAAGGGGACLPEGVCEGGDFARSASTQVPSISGWNYLDPSNLFATRDRFRAPVADLAQLARVVAVPVGTAGSLNSMVVAQGGAALDGTRLRYAGQSLGGIIGTLYTAASPAVERSLLNVPGADPAGILLTSPSFGPVRDAFLATLAAGGITPGTPQFDEFIHIARWILDPSDPQSAAFDLVNGERNPAGRTVLLQYITRDQVIPDWTTERLVRAANRGYDGQADLAVSLFDPDDADLPIGARHSFLNNPVHLPTTGAAQNQAAVLMATGATP